MPATLDHFYQGSKCLFQWAGLRYTAYFMLGLLGDSDTIRVRHSKNLANPLTVEPSRSSSQSRYLYITRNEAAYFPKIVELSSECLPPAKRICWIISVYIYIDLHAVYINQHIHVGRASA